MSYSKEGYTSIPQYLQSSPSNQERGDDLEADTPPSFHELTIRFGRMRLLRHTVVPPLMFALMMVITVQTIVLYIYHMRLQNSLLSPHGLSFARTVTRMAHNPHSIYVSSNETEAQEAWDSILAGHGIVAIDPEYAKEKGLPKTLTFGNELAVGGKYGYAIEAYHAMHCLRLRKHYIVLEAHEPPTWEPGHDRHCFEVLRRYIMCNIDDTLLTSDGRRRLGVGQMKKCQDWDALREWAERHSAQYFDFEPGTRAERHNDNYHEGDGLPVGSLE